MYLIWIQTSVLSPNASTREILAFQINKRETWQFVYRRDSQKLCFKFSFYSSELVSQMSHLNFVWSPGMVVFQMILELIGKAGCALLWLFLQICLCGGSSTDYAFCSSVPFSRLLPLPRKRAARLSRVGSWDGLASHFSQCRAHTAPSVLSDGPAPPWSCKSQVEPLEECKGHPRHSAPPASNSSCTLLGGSISRPLWGCGRASGSCCGMLKGPPAWK